jgi:UDP-glucose 4-epimerase
MSRVFLKRILILWVIHFAAFKSVPESVSDPILYYDNNINSLLNILKCCDKYGVNNFIFSSSCSIYGNVEKLPVTENSPIGIPESPYGHTKIVGEEIIKNFVKTTSIKAMPLRYFNPVGAHISGLNGENSLDKPNNLVPFITQSAAGILGELTVFGNDYDTRDGSCIRDYVHVTDIANAHILALKHLIESSTSSSYAILNLGTGTGITVLEAIDSFKKVSGIDLKFKIGEKREGDVAAIYSDSSKAKELLGWECKYNIDDMMQSAWKWQQQLLKK